MASSDGRFCLLCHSQTQPHRPQTATSPRESKDTLIFVPHRSPFIQSYCVLYLVPFYIQKGTTLFPAPLLLHLFIHISPCFTLFPFIHKREQPYFPAHYTLYTCYNTHAFPSLTLFPFTHKKEQPFPPHIHFIYSYFVLYLVPFHTQREQPYSPLHQYIILSFFDFRVL